MIFKGLHCTLIQLVNKLCNVANIIYSQSVQDTIYPSWIMHSKQVPISDDDYAPEHLIKPLTLWYPSNQDNCAPLSCFSTMTRPAMLEKGQLLKLQRHRHQQWVKNGKGSICLNGSKRECLKTDSNYCSPERLTFPLKETHTHKTPSGVLKQKAKSICSSLYTHTLLTMYKESYKPVLRSLENEKEKSL